MPMRTAEAIFRLHRRRWKRRFVPRQRQFGNNIGVKPRPSAIRTFSNADNSRPRRRLHLRRIYTSLRSLRRHWIVTSGWFLSPGSAATRTQHRAWARTGILPVLANDGAGYDGVHHALRGADQPAAAAR